MNIKDFFQNKKRMFLLLVGGCAIILFIIVFLVILLIGKKVDYSELENKLYYATQDFLRANPSYIPTKENPLITLSEVELVNQKYIKPFEKLIDDSCNAEITIQSINDTIQIKPFLTCNHYKSQTFFDKIFQDNPVTTSSNGLYDLNEMLVFRGDRVNNYVRFHNMMWRIVKMDPVTNQVTLILNHVKESLNDIWDNRYNSTEESRNGINDFPVSVIRYTLDEIYRSNFENAKSRMIPFQACVGKRNDEESNNDGSVECSYRLEDSMFLSLLPVYEYINASTDYQCRTTKDKACSNYNYLATKEGKWWTITGDGNKGTKVFGINYQGDIVSDNANSKRFIRYTILVDGTNVYQQGNGTYENPYMMK